MSLPPSPSPSKGVSPLGLAALGCGGLLLLIVVVTVVFFARTYMKLASEVKRNPGKAAAMLALKSNPNIEVINADDAAHQLTIRDKKTGEVTTFTYPDGKNANFTVTNPKGGQVTFSGSDGKVVTSGPEGSTIITGDGADSAPPGWVPSYPGVTSVNNTRSDKSGAITGTQMATSADAPAKIKAFFEQTLKAQGFQTEGTETDAGGFASVQLSATADQGGRKVDLVATGEQGKTNVIVTYEGVKP